MSITVQVYRGGRLLKTIERPSHATAEGVSVRYKGRLHPVRDGAIHVDAPVSGAAVVEASKIPAASDDSEQRASIIAAPANERMLVEAGPGTGKTETAARRLAALVQNGARPSQILVLSFSRSAVKTLTTRLASLGLEDAPMLELRHLAIRTFDAWCFLMLRRLGASSDALLARQHDENIAQFTALLSGPARGEVLEHIGARNHILVDEYQDLPGPRGDLLLALLPLLAPPEQPGCGFTILGDPAQAIYGFANEADGHTGRPELAAWRSSLLGLYGSGLRRAELTTNFRSQGALQATTGAFRSIVLSALPDEERLSRVRAAVTALSTCSALLEAGLPVFEGSTAILARTNGQCLAVARRLWKENATPLTLRTRGSTIWAPAWIGTLLRPLRAGELLRRQFSLIHSAAATAQRIPSAEEGWNLLAQIAGAPIDATAIRMETLRERMSWPDAFPDEGALGEGRILVTTTHQSKGMEFDRVLLLDRSEHGSDSDPAEEARVAYVAATRARQILQRLPSDAIHDPPSYRALPGDRQRLVAWRHGWMNVEMGLPGDVEDEGFVDPELLGGGAGVESVQTLLREKAQMLEGHRVMLVRRAWGRDTTWGIHLQEGKEPGPLLGRMSKRIAYDLLHLLHGKGYRLPKLILNLRIAQVRTCAATGRMPPLDPERVSGLWLGVALCGTGDFKTWKRE